MLRFATRKGKTRDLQSKDLASLDDRIGIAALSVTNSVKAGLVEQAKFYIQINLSLELLLLLLLL
jgi:hypothetical protein